MSKNKSEFKPVTPLLGIAIFCIPFISSWFTLRKGHSLQSRIIAFSWLIFSISFVLKPDTNLPIDEATASSGNGVQVLSQYITGSQTTLNQEPSINITLGGSTEQNNCTISVTRDYLGSTLGVLTNVKRNQPNFDVSCNWENKYYVLSNKHDTHANVQIIETGNNTSMKIGLNARLTTTKGELATFIGDDIVMTK